MGNQAVSQQLEVVPLPGVGDLLSRAWRIYKERIRVFLGIMILPFIVSFFSLLFTTGSKFLIYRIYNEAILLPWFLRILIFISPLFILPFIILAILLSLWAGLALIFAIKDRGEEIGIRESFLRGWHKIISYLWVSFLVGLVTLAGFLFFVIPGIIFAIWFSLSNYVLVVENLTGTKALSKSKNLVSGNWWPVFWRFLAIDAIAMVIFIPLALVEALFKIPNIIGPILIFLFSPLVTIYYFLIYENLRRIKEEST